MCGKSCERSRVPFAVRPLFGLSSGDIGFDYEVWPTRSHNGSLLATRPVHVSFKIMDLIPCLNCVFQKVQIFNSYYYFSICLSNVIRLFDEREETCVRRKTPDFLNYVDYPDLTLHE